MPESPLQQCLYSLRNSDFESRRAARDGPSPTALAKERAREKRLFGDERQRSPSRSKSPSPISTKRSPPPIDPAMDTTADYTASVLRSHGLNCTDYVSSPLSSALLERKGFKQNPDETAMEPEAYAQHVLRKQGISTDEYASSPMGSSLVQAKGRRLQNDADMDSTGYTQYVMRRHGLSDDVPSSPLSSALMKRKNEFQGLEQETPDTPTAPEDYAKYVMRRHGLSDDVPSSPLSSALMKRKNEFQVAREEVVDEAQVELLVSMFEMFDTFDIDGDGFIDKDEYWAISSQLNKDVGIEWTRAMSDLEVEDIDSNGDGVISPEEFYRHCRTKLAANRHTFDAAMERHQDVFMSPKELCGGLLSTDEYITSVLDSHDLGSDAVQSSPLATAILRKKRSAMSGDGERLADKLVREKMVDALVRAFEMFEEFDEDGNGVIDKNEYFRLSCKLFPNQERSREQSDAEVDAIDINGDGVISPEEFYQHCRMCLSADQGTFEQALRRHQDVLMDLSKPNAFAEADAEAKLLVRYGIQGSALIDKILPDQSRDDDGAIRPHGVRGQSEPSSSATKPVLKLEDHSEQVLEAYFHRLFALADHDKSGVLEHDEVKELLSASGFAIDQNSIEEIISNADLNHDGVIDYVEFMPMMLNIIRSRGVPQRLNVTDYTRDQLVAYFEALFHEFDRDANGVLDTHEVETLLKHTGFQFTPAEIARVMKNADTNADGLIDLDEFVPMMISGLATHTQKQLDISNHSPEVLTAYFKRLFVLSDHDNSGTLDHAEVEHLLQACGFNIAQETVTALVAAADTNRDGMIDYEEFSVLCVNVLSGAATLQGTLV